MYHTKLATYFILLLAYVCSLHKVCMEGASIVGAIQSVTRGFYTHMCKVHKKFCAYVTSLCTISKVPYIYSLNIDVNYITLSV